jgi:DNA-binding CsgD family transcriptional regulator/PAS domain-containing protein
VAYDAVEASTVVSEVVVATDLEVADKDLWRAVQNLELPLVLVDLSDFTIAYFTKAFLEELDLKKEDVEHRRIFDLYDAADRENSRFALRALADGKIDYFRSHRLLKNRAASSTMAVSLWVSAIGFGGRRFALAEACGRADALDSPLVRYLGYTPLNKAIGLTDTKGVVTTVSNNVRSVLGLTPERIIGRHLLRSPDERKLYDELVDRRDSAEGYAVSLPIDSLNHLGGVQNVRCIITTLADSSSLCFILVPISDETIDRQPDRVAQLEHHLWRIASEVQASGIFDTMSTMPDVARFPQLSTLSTRQWEVLSRLLRGERVPNIAKALFVSQSTVRNNLSSIFEKFGVHSQAELINLLMT